jgi:phage terminase large subunit GpA-like protein
MLRIHPEINEKVNWGDRTTGRKRKNIGRSKLFYRPATARALRMKAAPLIVGDEIDAWTPKTRDAAPTLITSRQEEFGSAAKAFLASHADAGPDGGIDLHLRDSLLHLWWVRCPHCGNAMSPAQEAEDTGARMTWNVSELLSRAGDMERAEFLESVQRDVRLCCPHDGCNALFDAEERKPLMQTGMWLQPHQRLLPDGTVEGEARISITMGFVIHAFMAPFVKLGETARDWAAAMLEFEATGNDVKLKEVIVKKLGETYLGAKEDEVVESWKVVSGRLTSRYRLKTVPAGVRFLTAFVDVQGDRYEVRVIGWDLGKQSWLIDAFAIKQWPRFGEHGAFDNIDPGGKLSDWDIIEEAVLTRTYPLADNDLRLARGEAPLFLPIARTMIDAVGVPGVTANARSWLSNLLSRRPGGKKRIIDAYRIALVHGASKKTAPLYGKPVAVEIDDAGKQRTTKVYERYPNVHELKRIISRRMRIDEPGPGRMHYPNQTYEGQPMTPRFLRELTAERFRNGAWVKLYKDNETWDAWVMCEVARETLKPDRPGLWDDGEYPEWADPRPRGQGIDSAPADPVNPFERLARLNEGIDGELER